MMVWSCFILSIRAAEISEVVEDIKWWDVWPDQRLVEVIEDGLQSAPDVYIAQARVKQAQAAAGQQRAAFLPRVSASWSSNTQPRDALGFGFGLSSLDDLVPDIPGIEAPEEEETSDLFTAGTAAVRLDVPLDIWGMGVSTYQAAQMEVLANSENQRSAMYALTVGIANAYYDLVQAQQQLTIINEQVRLTAHLLEVTQMRHERGEASVLDVLQQEQQLASIGTQVPRGQQQVQLAEQRLLVLLGKEPSGSIDINASFPQISSFAQQDLDRWMSARPDVLAAQYQVQSAEKRRYSAMVNFLPSLSVGGQLSRQANLTDEWETLDAWGVSTGASMTLFQGGGKMEGLRSATASVAIAEQSLRQVNLRAQQELQQIQLTEETQRSIREASILQLDTATRAFEEAERQYVSGLVPITVLFATQQAYQQAQINDIQTQRDQVRTRLQSYFVLAISQGGLAQ